MAEEIKVRTKTDDFKVALQAKVAEVAGVKVSKQKAWELFKAFMAAPFSFILKTYDDAGRPTIEYGKKYKELELPLSGVGTFKIIPVGGAEKTSVKGRYYLSSSIDRAIKERLGFEATEDADGEEADIETEAEITEPAEREAGLDMANGVADIDLDI